MYLDKIVSGQLEPIKKVFPIPNDIKPRIRDQQEFAVAPRFNQVNRFARRAWENDAHRCTEYLQHIVDDFCTDLNEAPPEVTYYTIYTFHLEMWIKTINHLKHNVKPKLNDVIINHHFFEQNYAPKI